MRCWQIHYVEENESFTSKAPATARPNFDLEFATAGDFGVRLRRLRRVSLCVAQSGFIGTCSNGEYV